MDTRDDIFAVAKELPPAERGPYLDAACESPEQRQRVEEMLREAQVADEFFAPFEKPPVPRVFEQPGDVIDRYKLLQKIGEGGFGVVFMAEQREPIVRRVALKIIKAGMDTRQVIARFEAERQALAIMEHPGIAKVFDAGATPTGRPYFVMELVRGLPITTFCDRHEYDSRQRIRLFGEVCSAVQHAHQKGIIHRDLKPSNIIVGLDGDQAVLKIIDFGIAKATQQQLTDKTLFTRFEQFIGTPLYISPEQASLSAIDIDTRSDIYSLGVLLYEILTGKPPIEATELLAGGFDEMRRIIREKEAPKPSTRLATVAEAEVLTIAKARQTEPRKLGTFIRGDLDWIVLKALEKDRRRRYETANALRADLERFLRNEPVGAAAPSRIYQIRKFVIRHRVGVSMAAAFAALLGGGTIVSTWQAVRATRAEERTQATLAMVAAERDQKDMARREAEAMADFLADVFRSPDPARGGRSVTLAEALDHAAAKLETSLSNQPQRRAKFQEALAATYQSLGLHQEAAGLREQVYQFHLRSSGPDDPQTASAMGELALAYHFSGRPELAVGLLERSLEILRRKLGSDDPETLGAMQKLAISLDETGRRAEAMELRLTVLDKTRTRFGPDHPRTLSAMQNLAISQDRAGNTEVALHLREDVLARLRSTQGSESAETLRAMHNLAISLEQANRVEEALTLRRELLEGSRRFLGPEHPDTVQSMEHLAATLDHAGHPQEALRLRAESGDLRRKTSAGTPLTLLALARLLPVYEATGRSTDADSLRAEIARRAEQELPEAPGSDQIAALTLRAESRARQGRWPGAAGDFTRLWEFDPSSIRALHLAAVLIKSNDQAAYRTLCQQVTTRFSSTHDAPDAERAAKICWLMPGAADLTTACALTETALAADGYDRPWALLTSGLGCLRQGELDKAATALDQCLASAIAPEGRAAALAVLAMVQFRQSRQAEAKLTLERSSSILGETFQQDSGTLQQIPAGQWYDWLIARCLQREAGMVLGVKCQ